MTRASCASLALFALLALSFHPCRVRALEDAAPSSKIAIPDSAAQRNPRKQINEVFGSDIAKAKKPAEKAAIARRLLEAGTEAKNDPAGKYEMLSMARDLAVAGGDAETALAAITELEAYAIDALKLKADALAAILRSTPNAQDALAIAANAGPLVDEALGTDHYAVAKQLAELAVSTAKAAQDDKALTEAKARVEEVREVEAASGPAVKAAATLSAKPSDPAACLTLGRFEAFFKHHWEKGLVLLASGSDSDLKALAQAELAAPSDPDKQLQVADGWWNASAKEKGAAKSGLRQHAIQWYKAALPKLSALAKAKAETRLTEARSVPVARTGWTNLLRHVKTERDVVSGEWAYEGGVLSVKSASRAIMRIQVKPDKAYELRVEYQQPDGGGEAFGVYLPVADNGAVLMVGTPYMGLDVVDGKVWGVNDTLKHGHFGGDKKKHTLDIAVWQTRPQARILVQFDGKLEVDWSGPSTSLTIYGPSAFPPPMSLGLLAINAPYVISGFALREYGDAEPPPLDKKRQGK